MSANDKGERTEMENFRFANILNCFSKLYEKLINKQLISPVNEFVSEFLSAHRKDYGIRLILD